MDRTLAREVTNFVIENIEERIKEEPEAVGVFTVERGKVKYDDLAGTVEITILLTEEGAKGRAQVDFEVYASGFGLYADDFGKEFDHGDHTFRIVGIRPRATKRPIIATRDDGKSFTFEDGYVRKALGRETLKTDMVNGAQVETIPLS